MRMLGTDTWPIEATAAAVADAAPGSYVVPNLATDPGWPDISALIATSYDDPACLRPVLGRAVAKVGADRAGLVIDAGARQHPVAFPDRPSAMGAIEAAHRVATGSRCEPRPTTGPQAGGMLVVELRSAGRSLGAVAFERDHGEQWFVEDIGAAEAFARHLAVGLDAHYARKELEEKIVEGGLVREQLKAYAKDVRDSYTAERARAEQLASALDELAQTYLATVRGLAIAVEAKDECTGGHLCA